MRLFENRIAAGRALAEELRDVVGGETCVVAVARGGVPVGYEVSRRLGAPLDVVQVKRLSIPEHPDVTMGAVAAGGYHVVNEDARTMWGLAAEEIDREIAHATAEVNRREADHRRLFPIVLLGGLDVVVVDDGAATGASLRVALARLRALGARRLVAAVPVAARDSCELLSGEADEFICPEQPDEFFSVADCYERFAPVTDDYIRTCVETAAEHLRPGAGRRSGTATEPR